MPSNLTIEDLVDLEYFNDLDQHHSIEDISDSDELHERDREIYLSSIQPILPESQKKCKQNRFILSMWLSKRREMYTNDKRLNPILPGDIFRNVYTGVLITLIIICFLSGSGASLSYLVYYGKKPVNVTFYLSVFVIFQFLLFFISSIYLFIRIFSKNIKGLTISQNVLYIIIVRLLTKAVKTAANQFSKNQRDIIDSKIALLKQKKMIFRSIVNWPVFNLAQTGSLFFNCGVLLATLFRVFTSDLAFGWQTTFQLGETTIYRFIASISIPWSWLIPSPLAHPTLDQVRGTHIILKEGISHMKTSDLTSWWPFLCFAVLFYGVLPRIFLLLTGIAKQHYELKNLDFNSNTFKKILLRMQTPLVNSKNESETDTSEYSYGSSASLSNSASFLSGSKLQYQKESCILIPEDIVSLINQKELNGLLFTKYGFHIENTITINFDNDMDKQTLDEIKTGNMKLLFIIQEAWQPPIQEKILFLKDLLGIENVENVILSFIGKPEKNSFFTSPEKNDILVWSKAIHNFDDPRIKSEILIKK